MKIEKINIDGIIDDKKYLTVALLVDQYDFIDLVTKARAKLSDLLGVKLPISYQAYQVLMRSNFGKPEMDEIRSLVHKSINWLHISIAYAQVLKAAIFTGEVKDTDFRPVLLSSEIGIKPKQIDPRYTHFMIITPNATEDDFVKPLFRYKAGFLNTVPEKHIKTYYGEFNDPEVSAKENEKLQKGLAEFAYLGAPGFSSREKKMFKKYRKWYWIDLQVRADYGLYRNGAYIKGKKLPDGVFKNSILEEISKDEDVTFKNLPYEAKAGQIRKALSYYQNLLWKSSTR